MLDKNGENETKFEALSLFVSKNISQAGKNRHLLLEYIDALQQRHSYILGQVKEYKTVLQVATPVLVYDVTFDFSADVLKLPHKPLLHTVDFQPCVSISDYLRNKLGRQTSTEHGEGATSSYCIEKQHEVEGNSESPAMNSVAHTDDFLKKPSEEMLFQVKFECTSIHPFHSGVWMSDYDSTELRLVDFQGRTKRTIKHTCNVTSTALSPRTNNLWFFCEDDLWIYELLLTSKSPIRHFKFRSCPSCFCISKEDNIVAIANDSISIYATAGRKMDTKTVLNELPRGVTNVEIPTVCQCPVTSNLAVLVNYEEDDDMFCAKLMAYDNFLQLKFKSNLRQHHIADEAAYDSRGYLIVLTFVANQRRLLLIDRGGQYIKSVSVEQDRISALGIQAGNVLWISVLTEQKKQITSTTVSNIKTIRYYKYY